LYEGDHQIKKGGMIKKKAGTGIDCHHSERKIGGAKKGNWGEGGRRAAIAPADDVF